MYWVYKILSIYLGSFELIYFLAYEKQRMQTNKFLC